MKNLVTLLLVLCTFTLQAQLRSLFVIDSLEASEIEAIADSDIRILYLASDSESVYRGNADGTTTLIGGSNSSADTVETLIFRHHVGNAGVFTSLAEAETVNSSSTAPELEDKFSRLAELENYRSSDGVFRFRLVYTEFGEEIEWTQLNNPVTDKANGVNTDAATGTVVISSTSNAILGTGLPAFGGMNSSSQVNTYYDLNPGTTWWYPIGQRTLFSNGMPAYSSGTSIVTTGAMEIYVTKITFGSIIVSGDADNALIAGSDGGAKLPDSLLPETYSPAPYSKKELWLKIGQSNAVGTDGGGPIDHYGLDLQHPKVFEYSRGISRAGSYAAPPAGEKMIFRHPSQDDGNGISFGQTFGKERVRLNPEIEELMIINRAIGGTGFSGNRWNPGNDLYTAAVNETIQAMNNHPEYVFKGILWHQGESDAGQTQAWYEARLLAMVEGIRSEVAAAAPGRSEGLFICGTMVETWIAANEAARRPIDLAHRNVANYIPNSAFSDFSDLTDNQDAIHFGTTDLREMGRRYAQDIQPVRYTALPSHRISIIDGQVVDLYSNGGTVYSPRIVNDPTRGEVLDSENTGFHTSMLLNNTAYTKSAWVNVQAAPIGYGNLISGQANTGLANGHYWGVAGSGQNGSSTANLPTGLAGNYTIGQWTHFTLTWNGSTHTLYVDGVQAGTVPVTAGLAPPQIVTLCSLVTLTNSTLDALVDDVVILPYAIDGAGALALYNQVLTP